jgi:hypothetical protein
MGYKRVGGWSENEKIRGIQEEIGYKENKLLGIACCKNSSKSVILSKKEELKFGSNLEHGIDPKIISIFCKIEKNWI